MRTCRFLYAPPIPRASASAAQVPPAENRDRRCPDQGLRPSTRGVRGSPDVARPTRWRRRPRPATSKARVGGASTSDSMHGTMTDPPTSAAGPAFIRDLIDRDRAAGRHGGRVATRFPPEPNGYLHIGHAKSICLNFGLAQEYGGTCNLRLDDTNPETEDQEFVIAIPDGVRWLGFDWGKNFFRASDHFERFYDLAGD